MNEPSPAPFVVGIDLGTTNCAVSYVDTRDLDPSDPPKVQVLEIPQVVRAGTVDAQTTLPSSLYIPGAEVAPEQVALPFDGPEPGTVIGAFARDQGAKVPHRLVSSSKSWLCHAAVDRRGAILPWEADPEEVQRISPVEGARRILRYLRAAWDHQIAQGDDALALERQDVLLTVPASFDPQARELTVEAARDAGLAQVTLLEEPQAAFYAWIERQGEEWRETLQVGDLVLVLDVGGGTTDLTLIAVREDDGNLALERVAVGAHLLLGGDNMDLALAHVAAERLGGKLDPWQSRALWHACRAAKEDLLSDSSKESAEVVILGRGRKLIGGSLKTQLTRADLESVVIQGFFPECGRDAKPMRRRSAGLAELGLPFEPEPAISKHLAAFLTGQDLEDGVEDGFAYATCVLFNGGVFRGSITRDAALGRLNAWRSEAGKDPIRVLDGEDLDLAVARGAAYYGLVRRGQGVRIRGGTASTYYVGIESTLPAVPGMPAPLKALCVAPFGMEEGTAVSIDGREFGLLVGEPAEFRFLSSNQRKDDAAGALLERWSEGELEELAPLQVTLPSDEGAEAGSLPVTLRSSFTEIGTLEVHCEAKDGRRFKLEWNVREAEGDS